MACKQESLEVLFAASVEGGVLRLYTSQASFLKFILDIILHLLLQVFVSSVILATETIWVFFSEKFEYGQVIRPTNNDLLSFSYYVNVSLICEGNNVNKMVLYYL